MAAPLAVTITVMLALTEGRYVPTDMLWAFSAATAAPFAFIRFLAGSDFQDVDHGVARPAPVWIRTCAAWTVMLLIATSASLGGEWSTYQQLPGSSTNPVAIITVPIAMFIAGVLTYAAAWLGTALFDRLCAAIRFANRELVMADHAVVD